MDCKNDMKQERNRNKKKKDLFKKIIVNIAGVSKNIRTIFYFHNL